MTTFPLPTSDVTGATIRYLGKWAWGNIGVHNYALLQGDKSRIDTKVTAGSGTNTLQVTIYSNTGTQPIDVLFNGVLQTRPTLSSAGAWLVTTIATNIPVGTNVTLQGVTGATFYLDTDYGLQITDGTTPVLSAPDNFGTIYNVNSGTFPTYSRREGGFVPFSGIGYTFYDGTNIDMSLRFTTNATAIYGWIYGGAGSCVLVQDGTTVIGSTLTFPSDGRTSLFAFGTGLSGTHDYEIHIINGTAGGHLLTLTDLMLVGGTLSTTTYAARDQYGFWGDSITQGDIGTGGDSRQGFVAKFGQTNNVGVVNAGHNSWTTANLLYDLTNSPPTPPHNMGLGTSYFKRLIVMIGVNDIATSVSTATYQANYTSCLNALIAAYPTTRIGVCQILPFTGGNSTLRPNYNAVLPAAIAACTNPANVDLFDISTGPGGTYTAAGDTTDGIHPSSAGCTKIGANLIALLVPTTHFSLSLLGVG